MVPGVNIAPAAFAGGHHHHHHNHISIDQRNSQPSACDHSDCSDSASNDASVH